MNVPSPINKLIAIINYDVTSARSDHLSGCNILISFSYNFETAETASVHINKSTTCEFICAFIVTHYESHLPINSPLKHEPPTAQRDEVVLTKVTTSPYSKYPKKLFLSLIVTSEIKKFNFYVYYCTRYFSLVTY